MNCPSCSGTVISPEGPTGEKVCSTCGLVLGETPTKTQNFNQWNPQWHSNWNKNDSETLKEWLTILRTVSCQLNIPNFPYREEAALKIRKGTQTLFKSQRFGKNKRAVVAALLHQVLTEYNKNRPLEEICKQLSLDSKLVTKQAWAINKTTITKQPQLANKQRKKPTDYLFERGGKLTADTKLLIEANDILTKTKRKGGNPIALAAGALYHVCKKKKLEISKNQIGEAFRISHRTVYTNEAKIRHIIQLTNPKENQTPQKLPLLTVNNRNRHP